MAGIQDVPIRVPEDFPSFRRWFPKFITDYLAPMDVRNAQGSGVTVSSDGNSVATLDATEELAAHVAEANPHSQYPLATDLAVYTQKNAAETIEAVWTFNPGYCVTGSTTVASLPSAATVGAGARAFVTDATSTTFNAAAAGGGANKVPVFSDGASWKVG